MANKDRRYAITRIGTIDLKVDESKVIACKLNLVTEI